MFTVLHLVCLSKTQLLTNTLIVHLEILYEGTMAKINAKLCMYKDLLSFVFINVMNLMKAQVFQTLGLSSPLYKCLFISSIKLFVIVQHSVNYKVLP